MYIDLCMPFVINNLKYIRIFRHVTQRCICKRSTECPATSIANRAVTSVIQGIASGLKGSNPTNDTSVLEHNQDSHRFCLIQTMLTVDPMQGHYILFGIRQTKPGKLERPKKQAAVIGGRGGDPRCSLWMVLPKKN